MSDEKSEIVWVRAPGRGRWTVYITRPEEKRERAQFAALTDAAARAQHYMAGLGVGLYGVCPSCGRGPYQPLDGLSDGGLSLGGLGGLFSSLLG